MIYKVGETSGEQDALMTKQVGDFSLQVAIKEKEKLDEVTIRLEKAIEAYNETLKEIT